MNGTHPMYNADDIIDETSFADLLIMSAEAADSPNIDQIPTALVREVLLRSKCPVIIAPSNFTGIEEVLFAYDGSESSMFAIKQFTHLFPKFDDTKIIYLEVNE